MTTIISNDKRKEYDNDEMTTPNTIQKKQKLFHGFSGEVDKCEEKVGATELASAFALASLASMSPQKRNKNYDDNNDPDPESRDADCVSDDVNLVSPETRSPIHRNKRVSFSSDTKKPTPRDAVSRIVSFSPRTNNNQNKSHSARIPTGGFVRPTAPPAFYSTTASRMYSTQSSATPHWMLGSLYHPSQSAFRIPATPPSNHSQTPPLTDKWICDFCNLASFDTYEEACVHERSCHVKCFMASRVYGPPSTLPLPPLPPPMNGMWYDSRQRGIPPSMFQPCESRSEKETVNAISSESQTWFQGTLSLSLPDSDKDWLSSINCYIRATCVEAFTANSDDVSKSSKKGRIALHQVGIRCRFCRDRSPDQKEIAAASYPESLGGIYESVKRWQRIHLEACHDIPPVVKQTIQQFGTKNAWIPTTRQYWVDSARALGMVDTSEGIRLSIDPKTFEHGFVPSIRVPPSPIAIKSTEPLPDQEMVTHIETTESTESTSEGESVVDPEDISMVPPYVYFLMRQVESTRFTEADRFVARSKGPVGFPGFQCRHCHGHAGLGKYFPISSKSLSTNSTSQNIHSHMLKCRKVNPYVKEQLLLLKDEKNKSPRLEPGWRRIFFDKIWDRLHSTTT